MTFHHSSCVKIYYKVQSFPLTCWSDLSLPGNRVGVTAGHNKMNDVNLAYFGVAVYLFRLFISVSPLKLLKHCLQKNHTILLLCSILYYSDDIFFQNILKWGCLSISVIGKVQLRPPWYNLQKFKSKTLSVWAISPIHISISPILH